MNHLGGARRWIVAVTSAALALAWTGCAQEEERCAPSCSLEEHVAQLANPEAPSCGTVVERLGEPIGEGREVVRECVEGALAAGSDFVVYHEKAGIDSRVEDAWVGVDGQVFRFAFDDLCLSAEDCCSPSIRLSECFGARFAPVTDAQRLIECSGGTAERELVCHR